MKDRFRHALFLHPCFFHAVINLTQLMIANGESMYAIDPYCENNFSFGSFKTESISR
jgi:hypothetical protein